MADHGKSIARNASIVAAATLFSRILGFVRDLIVASVLGAGLFADAFFVAFRVPNLMRRLFGEGSLTMAFIPVHSRIREEFGDEVAQEMARSAMAWLLVVLTIITILVEIFAHPGTMLIAPGFAKNPEQFGVTVELVRICFPYVIFICSVALCMGILNSSGQFLAPALAPAVLNVALIGSAFAGYFMGVNVAYSMAFGVLIGGAGQFALQLPFLRMTGFSWFGKWSWRNEGVRRMGLLMIPTIFGAAVYQLNIVFGTLLASFLPEGSVSYLYYADRLVQFPLGVFGLAVSTAALPSLARLAARKDTVGFGSALQSSMGLTLFIALPSAVGLAGLADPIISLLFQRGAFSSEAAQATSMALMAYSIGLPFIALTRPLVASFYAYEDTRTPVIIAAVCLFANIGLGWFFMQSLAHVGLALAVSCSSALNFSLLYVLCVRKLGYRPLTFLSLVTTILPSVGVFAGVWFTLPLERWAIALIPAWAVVYFVAAKLLRSEEAGLLFSVVRRRLSR